MTRKIPNPKDFKRKPQISTNVRQLAVAIKNRSPGVVIIRHREIRNFVSVNIP